MTNNHDESTSWGSIITGVLVGTVIGATVALLYAPKSGKETREDIALRLDDVKKRLDETARKVADMSKARFEESREDLMQAIDSGRKAAAEAAASMRKKAGL